MRARDPLLRFAPPRASDALRTRVLAGAGAVIAASTPPARTDEIWFSRRWRLAAVAALAACALIESLSVPEPNRPAHALTREADAAAAEVGWSGPRLIGDRVVANGDPARQALEESL